MPSVPGIHLWNQGRSPLAKRDSIGVFDRLARLIPCKFSLNVIRLAIIGRERHSVDIAEKVQFVRIELIFFATTIPIRHILGLVVDDRFNHGNGGGIERTFHSAQFANRQFHFGNPIDAAVLKLQNIQSLANRGMGHCGWHVEIGTLVQRRHKLLAKAFPAIGEHPLDLSR